MHLTDLEFPVGLSRTTRGEAAERFRQRDAVRGPDKVVV